MKNSLKNLAKFLMVLILVSSCQDDDKTFGPLTAPTNMTLTAEVVGADNGANPNGDGSGKVNLVAHADNALNYKFTFSDQSPSISVQNGITQKQFTTNGVHTYTVTAIAYGRGGVSTTKTIEVTVLSNFADDEAIQMLTGGGSKVWYWAAALPGHLGVGPNNTDGSQNYLPVWYAAAPFEKLGSPDSSCLYDNVLTFTKDGNLLKYTLNNGGKTFFNAAFNSVGGSSSTSDQCSPYDVSGQKIVQLSPSNSLVDPSHSRGTSMTFSDGGFMGYYIGQSTYEILELTNTKMVVRAVMGNDPGLAWYHTFTTTPPNGGGDDPDFTNLVWEDNFDTDGAPDPANWAYDLGTNNGWGNNEVQNYTNSASNVVVQGGVLKITAKKEANGTYTSARIKTEGKRNFTYGKIEFKAKLPTGGGTWPALWALGSNYQTNPWPACGEIDVMEHVGNQQNVIHGTLHYPGASGGNANTGSTTVPGVSDGFHIYTVIWHQNSIKFYVDGTQYHSYNNNPASPFNADFFLIMNIAMGGNMGGAIDPAFSQSTMEVDYVRVYQ